MITRPTDDQILEAVSIHETKQAAADALKIPRTTLRDRLRMIRAASGEAGDGVLVRDELAMARRGELGFAPVLPGYEIKETSTEISADGTAGKSWVRQRQEAGPSFSVPAGHRIKGVSALVSPDGRELAKWVKTGEEQIQADALVDAIKATFDSYTGMAKIPAAPAVTDDDLLTVYTIADHHLGLLSWHKEVGVNYDMKTASRVLLDSMESLVSGTPNAKQCVVLGLGDFVHADNNLAQTERSGNRLDVDTRYANVLQTGVRLLICCVEMALTKHETVLVRILPGNHDPHTALALTAALGAFYNGHERVQVDSDPGRFFRHVHGRTMIAATHGDMVKPEEFPGVMASMWPKDWGNTVHRYAYFGHVHHRSKGGGEKAGVVWETFQTLAAKDAWHHASGYVSGRSMVAITHHAKHGEYCRHTVTVPDLSEAA